MEKLGKKNVFKGFSNKAISGLIKKETGSVLIFRYILVPNYIIAFVAFLIILE